MHHLKYYKVLPIFGLFTSNCIKCADIKDDQTIKKTENIPFSPKDYIFKEKKIAN